MRVLLLSPYGGHLANSIRAVGDQVIAGGNYVDPEQWPEVDFIIMYGHRRLIKEPTLSKYKNRIINIHGSYLPWNRGAYPNLFSWVDGTPKGASILHVNAGVDTGRIIVRQSVDFSQAPRTTLASSYEIIKRECEVLFERSWPRIRRGDVIGMEQKGALGTSHTKKDAEPIIAKLSKGWDTPVRELKCLQEPA